MGRDARALYSTPVTVSIKVAYTQSQMDDARSAIVASLFADYTAVYFIQKSTGTGNITIIVMVKEWVEYIADYFD